jgi:uncharacterized protein (TIGR02145 family)
MRTLITYLSILFLLIVPSLAESLHAQLPEYIPTEGLVSWWPFNGNANDESGNGNNGTVNGATLTSDRFGATAKAYNFDGSNDNINPLQNNLPLGTSARTVSIWFQSLGLGGCLFSYGSANTSNAYMIEIGSNIISNQGWADDFPVYPSIDNNWHHLVCSFDGLNVSIYLDNVNLGNGPMSNWNTIAGSFFFGTRVLNDMDFFNGNIDDIGLWSRVLTYEEIQQLYTLQTIIMGCTDPTACNYDPLAEEDNGSCFYAQEFYDCAGNCLADFDGDGACDELEVLGCTYAFACNFNPQATQDDGSCTIAECNYDCEGNCLLDMNNNGVCDLEELPGCTSIDALNYNPDATLDDGSCIITCKGDFNNDGQITVDDLLAFLAAFGNYCSGAGCMDPAGCNFDPEATFDLGYCIFPEAFYNCEGACLSDVDEDGVCDELELLGCTDPSANNYNPEATDDDGSCNLTYMGELHTCGAESVHNPELEYGSVMDVDGNSYRTIVIGGQEWMAENLNTTHFNNGDEIPNVILTAAWANQTQGAYCYYNNEVTNACPYGLLYNWYVTVDDRNVCPSGWHVPSDSEWSELSDYLGGEEFAGEKMKSSGTEYWQQNSFANNESGFSSLPGGYRFNNGNFNNNGSYGYWWSSTSHPDSPLVGWFRRLHYYDTVLGRSGGDSVDGFSIRCIKD